jgi:pyruvate,water dikinase
MVKVRELVGDLAALDFSALPDIEDLDGVVRAGLGVGSGYRLLHDYQVLLDLAFRLWQYHFEFLNLGYAAYLDFFGFCTRVWPSIPEQAIAAMVAGVEVDLFRPDEELKSLARRALALGIHEDLRHGDADEVWERLGASAVGRQWLEAYETSAEPWFNFSTGSGFYHSDRIWIEAREVPLGFIRGYLDRLGRGEPIDRPLERIRAERDRIVTEYTELIDDEATRAAFEAKLELARTVFPYVENHNFYVEHWSQSIIWRQMRRLGRLLADQGFWSEANDIFYLRRTEVSDAIWDYYVSWATPVAAAGPHRWPTIVADRRRTIAALRTAKPLRALGEPPEVVTEPFTVMLWGVTGESIAGWLGRGDDPADELSGFGASPGIAEGPARVIVSADQIGEVQDGEVLVAPLTAPSWAPLFGRIAATVTDTGGMMSHAAIVCREYGLPAVTGTGHATTTLRTGMRIRVDGTRGTVTILDP